MGVNEGGRGGSGVEDKEGEVRDATRTGRGLAQAKPV
jgi:hypothetical protein